MDVSISQIVQVNDSAPNSDTDASNKSGTIIVRPVWDCAPTANGLTTTITTNTPDVLGPRTDAGAGVAPPNDRPRCDYTPPNNNNNGGSKGGRRNPDTDASDRKPGNIPVRTPPNNNDKDGSKGGRHNRDTDSSSPYRDEDVLLSLQLLAYLSKYPHVKQAFYKPRVTFHLASSGLTSGTRYAAGVAGQGQGGEFKEKEREKEKGREGENGKEREGGKERGGGDGFFPAFALSSSLPPSGLRPNPNPNSLPHTTTNSNPNSSLDTINATPSTSTPLRQMNIFSLVERFTFKPSSTETDLPNPPRRIPPEIQYWAGVIMRNACRKDDSRGGIRQCANSEFCSGFSFRCFLSVSLFPPFR